MIKKIMIKNFRGIRNKMEIDFTANSRRKADKNGIKKTSGGEILLVSSLIAKNASGKTSFIDGITFVKSLAHGGVYEHWFRYLTQNQIDDDKKPNYSITPDKVNDEFVSSEFNNRNKNMEFVLQFTDNNHVVGLEIKISNKGIVSEKIILDNEIFSSNKTHLQNFKSNILSKDLPFKKVEFIAGSDQWGELLGISRYQSNFKFTKKIPRDLVIEWLSIADPKIVKGIWTAKDELDYLVLKFNDGDEKKISLSELSSGSRKWLSMFYEIIPALLKKQSFLFFDELERSLHPSLAIFIMKMFNDSKVNKKKSQLFFTTHSPILVDEMERKDSINYIDDMGNIINMGNDLKLREDLKITKNFIKHELGSHPKISAAYYFLERLI